MAPIASRTPTALWTIISNSSASPCVCRAAAANVNYSSAAAKPTSQRSSSSFARSVSTSSATSHRHSHRRLGWTSSFSNALSNLRARGPRVEQRQFHSSPSALLQDPYKIIGVGKEASASEIKRAYYQLAKKYHPDSNKEKGAKERFMEIQEAYDILSDEKRRADFDRFGPASTQQGFDSDAYARASSSFGGAGFGDFFGGAAGGSGGAGPDIFESLFGAFGGGRGGSARPGQAMQPGDDIEIGISLPFLDAAKGTTRTVTISPVVDCGTCKGSGMKDGAQKSTCRACNGSGTRTFTIQSGFQMASTCNACGGSGSVTPPGSACGSCNGVGKVRERKSVEVRIPPGVDDGMKIRIDGQGDAPLGGKGRVGDLYVRVQVQPSKTFQRQGANLYQEVPVPFYTAILGGRARVATLDRDVEVKVPQGTQPGEEMVLRGRGVKKLYKDEFGDLVVRFGVQMPRTLTPAQKRILQQFVSETEFPGSSSYSPSSASSNIKNAPAEDDSKTTPISDTPSPKPKGKTVTPPDENSPGFTSQAKPPPSEAVTGKWWSTMDNDPSKASKARTTSETAASQRSTDSSSPSPKASATSEPTEKKTEEVKEEKKKEEDHGLLGDLWNGKEKVKDALGCEEGEQKEKNDGKKAKKEQKKRESE